MGKKFWRFIVALLTALVFILGISQCKAQLCSTPTDTVIEGVCIFHDIDTVYSGTVGNVCHYFKPSTEYINLGYMLAQGTGCGPVQYSYLNIRTYTDNCDTLMWLSKLYPNPQSNTFIGPFDTTRYYYMCANFRASCNLIKVCFQYNISPLPVTLEYFKAYREKGHITVEWKTQSETNSDYFILERANDNYIFIPINKSYAQGNKSYPTFYLYKDISPYEGINYYRLQQVDWDGHTVEYGPVAVPFKITDEDKALFIYYDLIGRRIK